MKFKKNIVTRFIVLALAFVSFSSHAAANDFSETLAERDARTAWWREARFGMFIHWDMSSIAGTEISWSRQGSRPLDNGSDPAGYVADPVYDNLYKHFNPTNFDATAWVRLAKAAGMKYLVFTAKHHGGFCMWDTKFTDYSIMNTPFRRDVVKELADACHAAGLKFGIYYSPRDWHQPDYGIGDNEKYVAYLNGQLRELLTNYGQVDVLWFDSYGRGDPQTFWRVLETWSLIKTLQPQVIINNRLAALRATNNLPQYRGDFDTPEQKLGSYKDGRLWESCITVITAKHGGWSYRPDGKVKSVEETLRMLVNCATGDGNLLLDVGPDASGVIPDDQAAPLLAMGKWLETNGESIYGTRGGPFKPGEYGGTTRRGKTIYLHVLKWPDGALKLPALAAKVLSGRILGGGEVSVKQSETSLEISVPAAARQSVDTIVKLELDRDVTSIPAIDVAVAATPSGPADEPREAVRTPKPLPTPHINGPKIFGVRPGSPFLFRIPATGERPMTFAVEHLPTGLSLAAKSGIITGALKERGAFVLTLVASNALGAARRDFRIEVGDRIALTPPMGWNTYYAFRMSINDVQIRAQADALVASGLADHGWNFINLDDGWENRPDTTNSIFGGPARDDQGGINSNQRFPDMKNLCDYLHAKGLKAGIYSSPGMLTCGKYYASYGHEAQDARRFAEWGFDYLKYDWCSYSHIATNPALAEMQRPYQLMADELKKAPRDICFSLCQYGNGDVWRWGAQIGGNCWRTTHDIVDSWRTVSDIGFGQAGLESFAGPGHWNDPDMLQVGLLARNRATRLTPDEQYSHLSLWCLLAAPLIIGGDLTKLDDFTLGLLSNDEVLEVNQDPLGQQAARVAQDNKAQTEVWAKRMEDGSRAVGLFSRLIGKGVDVGLPSKAAAPDLGAYEFDQ
jgi:alpha-L-fucosidase